MTALTVILHPDGDAMPPVLQSYFEIRLASGQGRVKICYKPPSSHPQIDKSIFYISLLDLSSIPRAREGAPGGLPAPKSVSNPPVFGRKPPVRAFWRLFWAHFRFFWRSWGFICSFDLF